MLLTIPWALSVFAGRVDIINGKPNYRGKTKLLPGKATSEILLTTGVAVSDEIRHGGIVMALTTIPYFLIQIPALFMHGPAEEVAEGEHWWALGSKFLVWFGLFLFLLSDDDKINFALLCATTNSISFGLFFENYSHCKLCSI
jgi:hypothetical protein